MSALAVLGAIITGLVVLVGALLKKVFTANAATTKAVAERDSQVVARKDDAGRLEDVITAKNVIAARALNNVPQDIGGVRNAVTKLGGAPLPLPSPKKKP